MGTFVPNTKAQQQEMLKEIGYEKLDDLFAHIPDAVKFQGELDLPAGLSEMEVSKAMKKIAGPIRTELAQYRELASFAQFGSELDEDTKARLAQGERIREVLKQPQYKPLPVEKQIITIYALTKKYLIDIPVNRILEFENGLLEFVDTKYPEIYASIRDTKEITEENDEKIREAIDEFKAQF